MTLQDAIERGWCPHLFREVDRENRAKAERRLDPLMSQIRVLLPDLLHHQILPPQPLLGETLNSPVFTVRVQPSAFPSG
jgi:hypothetical protein